jgi:hypothetical protein
MNLGKITLITPPDKLFNLALSYLLVNPSNLVKEQFQAILKNSIDDVNVFIYDQNDTDIEWLLGVAQQVDVVVVDIDNCDPVSKIFVSYLLAQPNCYYVTTDEVTPFGLINKNRIYDLAQIVEQFSAEEGDDEQDE